MSKKGKKRAAALAASSAEGDVEAGLQIQTHAAGSSASRQLMQQPVGEPSSTDGDRDGDRERMEPSSPSSPHAEDAPLILRGEAESMVTHRHGTVQSTTSFDEVLENLEHFLDSVPRDLDISQLRTLRVRFEKRLEASAEPRLGPALADALDPRITFAALAHDAWERSLWLVMLLVLQSCSSFILEQYSTLIEHHLLVTFFLTMVVGAGGNAGNQSAVAIIRGLALGSVTESNRYKILKKQVLTGLMISSIMIIAGYGRVVAFGGDSLSSFAISTSLFLIVFTSIVFGTVLPLGLNKIGLDPAHAGPAIQVLMDIIGVLITCMVCSWFFGTSVPTPAADMKSPVLAAGALHM